MEIIRDWRPQLLDSDLMATIGDKIPSATASLKMAQIVNLVKENQLLTAAIVFIAWQLGVVADATSYVGGMC